LCHALNNVGAAGQWLDFAKGRRDLARSLGIALAGNFQEHAARAFTNCACVEMNRLNLAEAEAFLDRGIAYCVENDLATWRDYMRGVQAQLLLRRGLWNEAAAVAHDVIDDEATTALVRYPHRLSLAGDWQGAAAFWNRMGAPFERALALLQGDEVAQREALDIFEELGARPVAQHVRGMMRQSGVSHVARGPRQAT
ncbi:MAG: helix-turn-helix transcriptional regulator, partial [Mesorhizobium sp.]